MIPKTIRCSPELDARITEAIKSRGFASVSAFVRMAIENELRRSGAGTRQADERVAATIERLVAEIRKITTGQQALFAFVDTLAKTVLTCVPEPVGDAYQQAVARAKARYDRFLKSAGAGMTGESGRRFAELAEHG